MHPRAGNKNTGTGLRRRPAPCPTTNQQLPHKSRGFKRHSLAKAQHGDANPSQLHFCQVELDIDAPSLSLARTAVELAQGQQPEGRAPVLGTPVISTCTPPIPSTRKWQRSSSCSSALVLNHLHLLHQQQGLYVLKCGASQR